MNVYSYIINLIQFEIKNMPTMTETKCACPMQQKVDADAIAELEKFLAKEPIATA